eukprot:3563250-Pleurochrysis_carterae.AAC.3
MKFWSIVNRRWSEVSERCEVAPTAGSRAKLATWPRHSATNLRRRWCGRLICVSTFDASTATALSSVERSACANNGVSACEISQSNKLSFFSYDLSLSTINTHFSTNYARANQ